MRLILMNYKSKIKFIFNLKNDQKSYLNKFHNNLMKFKQISLQLQKMRNYQIKSLFNNLNQDKLKKLI